jgi:hypothetical protein
MVSPLHAVPLDASSHPEAAQPRRHRRVVSASFVQRVGATEAGEREASELITLLADALERIAETSTDAAARGVAEDALALFQGR